MARIEYTPRNFTDGSLAIIAQADRICADYAAQGYDLTLRQLYYQFVSRDLIRNKDTEYKRLGSIINDARLAGLLDWDYITDRTRNLEQLAHWNDPQDGMAAIVDQYRTPRWELGQAVRVEVWVEKDALIGVLERICNELDVPYFSCRGYTSQSEIWGAAQRLEGYLDKSDDVERVVILRLGDHDPSGLDMTRDIRDRLELFLDGDGYDPGALTVDRIALNMDQVRQYNPPPNPAKLTDSRGTGYVRRHGMSSWELDALDPATLSALIRSGVKDLLDGDAWATATADMALDRRRLRLVRERWAEVVALVDPDPTDDLAAPDTEGD